MYTFEELLGYFATLVTISSFAAVNQYRMRLVNTAGAIIWICYGFMIVNPPIWLTNGLIVLINLRWFWLNRFSSVE